MKVTAVHPAGDFKVARAWPRQCRPPVSAITSVRSTFLSGSTWARQQQSPPPGTTAAESSRAGEYRYGGLEADRRETGRRLDPRVAVGGEPDRRLNDDVGVVRARALEEPAVTRGRK